MTLKSSCANIIDYMRTQSVFAINTNLSHPAVSQFCAQSVDKSLWPKCPAIKLLLTLLCIYLLNISSPLSTNMACTMSLYHMLIGNNYATVLDVIHMCVVRRS